MPRGKQKRLENQKLHEVRMNYSIVIKNPGVKKHKLMTTSFQILKKLKKLSRAANESAN